MSTFSLSLILFLLLTEILLVTSKTDYYWRDYEGKIPEDAISGGRNKDGEDIYIGQAYVRDKGLIVVHIDPGQRTVYAEMGGPKLIKQNIRILCGPPENFYWMQTNVTKLQNDLTQKKLVVGGHEDGWGKYFVARIKSIDGDRIGKVLEKANGGRSLFYGVDRTARLLRAESYEVLVNEIIIQERFIVIDAAFDKYN